MANIKTLGSYKIYHTNQWPCNKETKQYSASSSINMYLPVVCSDLPMLNCSDSKLGDYEFVQMCLKLDMDIRLILMEMTEIPKTLLRTAEDDKQPVFVPKHREGDVSGMKITRWVIICMYGHTPIITLCISFFKFFNSCILVPSQNSFIFLYFLHKKII